jgi:phosphonate transport system substrate-binding protein
MNFLKINTLLILSFILFFNGKIAEENNNIEVKASAPEAVYTFAIVPQFHSQSLFRIWNPIIQALNKETGLKFRLSGNSSFIGFENELKNGKYDIAYVNPYHAYMAHNSQKYEAILSDTEKKVQGILVVKKDSKENAKTLTNKEVAFPSPNTLASSIMLRSELESKFKVKVRPQYLKTHTDVYMNVYKGNYSAGGGVERTFEKLSPKIKNALKIVHKTAKIPAHPIVIHPRVPKEVRAKVIAAFIQMGKVAKTKGLLQKIPVENITTTDQSVYKSLLFTASL